MKHSAVLAACLLTLCLPGCNSLRTRMALKHGNELYNAEKYEEAVGEYQKILAIEPNNWDANYLTAASYMALYHPGSQHPKDVEYSEKAIAAFKRCLEIGPPPDKVEQVRNFYLGLLTSANKQADAAKFMEELLAKDPQNASLTTQLANLYAKQGDFPNALKYFERRAQLEPSNKEAWYTIGVVCWDRSYNGGMFISAEERAQVIDQGMNALNKALAIDADYFDALSYVNLLYREKSKLMVMLGKYQEAQEAYATADEYMKKALEARKKQQAAPAKAG
ncbi:MAG TPA: tetratricopeptide repeat protein [Candidatus Polarisedimenticolaceae bacterium]|nr:tetratricopeptide repeat protein [Candidatus Polarisedimenticolaceae bacterium]